MFCLSNREAVFSKMLRFFFYFLTVLSYNHLTVTKARTQHEENFSTNLIHRYSPASPFYNSSISSLERLQRQIIASKARHDQLKWLQSNELDAPIITNQGDYLMVLYVGTPPVALVAVVDTSIDLTWFQCAPCANCYRQIPDMFNPEGSTTFQMVPCDSRHCSSLDTSHITCNQGTNQCLYWYSFGNDTTMTQGILGNDTFSFISSDGERSSFPLTVFGCGFDQVGVFDPRSTGVAGLGNGPLSLVSQLSYEIDYKFSYCLALYSSNSTSRLRFGPSEMVRRQGTVTTPFLTKDPASFYNLELDSISIGQTMIQVDNDIIIDTATTLTYLTPRIFTSLESIVNAVIGMKPMTNSLVDSVLCYARPFGTLNPPDIVFHFSGGDLVLKGENVFFEHNGSLCLSIVATPEDDDPMIFGNMAQVNLEVEFDLISKTVTFAPKDCARDN